MADVSKIQGPSGSPETPGKKDKAAADADKFQEAMRRRVTEVSQVDPDEQKKRKRGEEAEEDEALAAPQPGPTTPKELVTPFSLEQEAKKASPLDLQKGGPGISPTESAQPTPAQLPSAPKTAFFQAPASDEMADDSGMLEEESFGVGASTPAEEPAQQTPYVGAQETTPAEIQPQQPSQPQPQGRPSGWAPEGQQPVAPGPPESSPQHVEQQSQGQLPGIGDPPEKKKKTVPGIAPKIASPLKEEEQKQAAAGKIGAPSGPEEQKQRGAPPQKKTSGLTAAHLENTQTSKMQDTSGFFEQLGKEGEGQGQGQKGKQDTEALEESDEEAAVQEVGAPVQPTPFEQVLEGLAEKNREEKENISATEITGLPTGTAETQAMAHPPGPEALPPYANLNPQMQDLFDRMVGVMTVMNMSGMTETVLTLNSPQFASSVFFGTQIIIQEFSTAPQAFNIQLNGSAQAVALFQGNADDLMAAFQSGNYNFRVNRLETGYLTERPLFKRKEKAGGDHKDQTGDNLP
jgi:hypothetical protein